MPQPYVPVPGSRSSRLDRTLAELLMQAPELEAAAVVSFDGLPMASRLPEGMEEGRVAAMSAALLSLGERAADGLGRGALAQVYIEGEHGTVFLVSADDEAVLVAVARREAKAGLMLYEVRRAATAVAEVLRREDPVQTAEVPEPGSVGSFAGGSLEEFFATGAPVVSPVGASAPGAAEGWTGSGEPGTSAGSWS
ncbi:MAG: roadblock/LC7 domain-containing protein [Actinomycetes bacterium]